MTLVVSEATAQKIEVVVQKGHSADINFVTFNSNGRLLASSGGDNLIKIWHVPTGKEMTSFISASREPVVSLAFGADDEQLYVLYRDKAVHSWNISSSSLASTNEKAASASFSTQQSYPTADSSFIFTLDRFYLTKKDRRQDKILFSRVPIDIAQNFSSLAVHEGLARVFGACLDGKIYTYDTKNGKGITVLDKHLGAVNSICFSPDGMILASASSDRSIILWDSKSLVPIRRLFSRSFRFESLTFDHSGSLLAVGDELGKVRIIDLKSSRVKVSTYSLHEQRISDIKFSPDDRLIFSAGMDNRLIAFDVGQEKIITRDKYRHYVSLGDLLLKSLKTYREPYAWVNTVALSPSGQFLASGGSWREAVIRREPQKIVLKNLGAIHSGKIKSHQGVVKTLTFIDENTMLSGGGNNLYSWHLNSGLKDFFFRENKLQEGTNIDAMIPFGKDTVLISTGDDIVWYDLRKERIVKSLGLHAVVTSMGMDPSSQSLAYSIFNDLTVIRGETGEKHTVKEAHTDKITSLGFSPDGKLLATASWDATIKLWNAFTAELLLTIIPIGNNDHIIITPDNYYFGTRNSLKGIGFKYGKQFISPEQFDLRFNRPDLVLARLGMVAPNIIKSYRRAYQKRLQRMNFTEQMLSEEVHLPEVRILNEDIPLRTTQHTLPFKLQAIDSKYHLDRINVFVNNIPVFGIGGIDLRELQQRSLEKEIEVNLNAGKNKIQVSCLNEKGVESLLETFEVEFAGVRSKPNLYLTVISVSKYQNASMNLKYATKDGRDLVKFFTQKSSLYNKVILDTLLDASATKENIINLKSKFANSTVDDQVMVFVSGHGLLDDNLDFYFGTPDVDFNRPSIRGLKYDDLENLLDGIPARKKLLMMDACHSGEVDKTTVVVSKDESMTIGKNQKGTLKSYSYPTETADENYQVGMKNSFELMQELFASVSKGSGSVVISAAAGNSYALESDEWKNGVFTYSLLAGMKSGDADANGDDNVTVSELKDFVSKEVERLTKGAQKPTSRKENLEFDFIIW